MFSTFTTRGNKTLIIRTEDVRSLYDQEDGDCSVTWVVGSDAHHMVVKGTARENFERLKREEIEAVDAAQKAQLRSGNRLPMLPVPRGRP